MKKRWFALLVAVCLLISLVPTVSAATDPGEKIVYGQSGAGRDLVAWRYGRGPNVMVLVFAIHGWEDNWDRDGEALVYTAEQLRQSLSNSNLAALRGWSVYVIPTANPDGLYDGTTCDGPGRCTTTYLDENGNLKTGKGIDMNRCFPVKFNAEYGSRNYTGPSPLACREAKALASFVSQVKGSGSNILMDVHGWYAQTIVYSGKDGLLNTTIAKYFPGNSYTAATGAKGYLIAYGNSLGYDSCLLELPRGIYSLAAYKNSGYAAKVVSCINDLIQSKPPVCNSGHQYQDTRVEPTCGKDGSLTRVCSICGDTVTQVLPATGKHSYDSQRVEPDCIHTGLLTQICKVCGYKNSQVLPATGIHTYTSVRFEPTCVDPGKDVYTCSVCRAVYEGKIPALGHTPNLDTMVVLFPNTATRDGQYTALCSRCGDEDCLFAIPKVFRDTKDTYYSDAVDEFYEKGILKGTAPNLFAPLMELDRAMLITILYRCAGSPESNPEALPFVDVPQKAWYAQSCAWAYENGITLGVSDTDFAPSKPATREQAAAILQRYAAYTGVDTTIDEAVNGPAFSDWETVSPFARDGMEWCITNHIIQGTGDLLIAPRSAATRSQAAVMCWRLVKLLEGIGSAEMPDAVDAPEYEQDAWFGE